jgi:hypothetical protein
LSQGNDEGAAEKTPEGGPAGKSKKPKNKAIIALSISSRLRQGIHAYYLV